MADTTSNEGKTIATKGTQHTAVATAPDMCFVPGIPAPQPFPNQVPSTRLAAGQTTKTFIGSQPVVTSAGELGPPSDPAHAGVLGGVKSGTYRFEAQATTYSKNVYFENKPVVRTGDLTFHNHKNTMGSLLGSSYQLDFDALKEENKQKCTITKIEGKDGDGRKLGYPGKKKGDEEPTYLEVLSTDTVTFQAHRYDITKHPNEQNPSCRQKGRHTRWFARSVSKPHDIPRSIPPEVTDGEYKVDASIGFDMVTGYAMSGEGASPEHKVTSAVYDAILFFLWKASPPTIDVEALACGGPKTALLKVFPAKKFSAEYSGGSGDKYLGTVEASCTILKKVCEVAQRIARWLGGEFEAKFLVGLKVAFELQYKKCKEEKISGFGKDMYSPSRVGLAWEFSVAASPLIGLKGKITGSLLNFVVPGMGQAVAQGLRRAEIGNVDLTLSVSISSSVNVSVGLDEYDYPTKTGSKTTISSSISLAVEIGLASFKIIEFKATYTAKFTATFRLGDRPNVLQQLIPEGNCELELAITLFPDKWYGIEAFSMKPEWAQFKFEGKPIDVMMVAT